MRERLSALLLAAGVVVLSLCGAMALLALLFMGAWAR